MGDGASKQGTGYEGKGLVLVSASVLQRDLRPLQFNFITCKMGLTIVALIYKVCLWLLFYTSLK